MRTQTMGSQGGAVQEHKLQNLAWQGSFYSLTLAEVQNQLGALGKPLGSMNLDELSKSVWTAEANQGSGNGVNNSGRAIKGILHSGYEITLKGITGSYWTSLW